MGLATVSGRRSPASSSSRSASGTGASQADKVYSQEATILTGATLSLDLKGSLTDALGAAFAPAKLRGSLIYSRPRTPRT